MYHYFAYQRDTFLTHYHKRSNVETTFSMIKRKFGSSLRSKSEVGQRNEVLCKVIAHNLCCLISAMHELGMEAPLRGARSELARRYQPTKPETNGLRHGAAVRFRVAGQFFVQLVVYPNHQLSGQILPTLGHDVPPGEAVSPVNVSVAVQGWTEGPTALRCNARKSRVGKEMPEGPVHASQAEPAPLALEKGHHG